MKLRVAACALACGTACPQATEQTGAAFIGLDGPSALALAPGDGDDVLFIASANTDELRALKIASTGRTPLAGPGRAFAAAVVGSPGGKPWVRPQRLAAVRFPEAAGKHPGALLVAGAEPRLRVVDPLLLVEASVLELDSVPLDVAADATVADEVPAWAALSPDGAGKGGIAFIKISLAAGKPAAALTATCRIAGAAPVRVAPGTAGAVYAADALGDGVLEVKPDCTTRRLTAGGPARALALAPAYQKFDATDVPAGAALWVVLSDGLVQIVDPVAGKPFDDPFIPGTPRRPLQVPGSAREVAFLPQADPCCDAAKGDSCPGTPPPRCQRVLMPAPTAKTTYVPLVAAISSANGSIYFADADAKALLDSAPDRAPTNSTPKLADPENTALVLPADGQPVLESIALVKGMSRTELWTATFAGVLPGLQERAGTLMAASPLALFVPGEEFSAHPALRDGDRVQIAADPTNCAALRDGGDFTVTHIGLDTLDLDAGSLPVPAAECLPAAVVYSVLAGAAGPAPWVVHGTASGYAGRATAGTPFSFTGTRWHYPEDPRHIPVDPPNAAAISFVINGPAPHRTGETSSPGLAFGFAVDDGLVRVLLAASDVAQRTSSGALLPGAMLGIHAPPPPDVGPAALPRLFVAYTGSDLILEVNPGLLGVTGDVLLYR